MRVKKLLLFELNKKNAIYIGESNNDIWDFEKYIDKIHNNKNLWVT